MISILRRYCRLLPYGLALLGLAAVSFVLGAAVVHFHLPPADVLERSFEIARGAAGPSPQPPAEAGVPPVVWSEQDGPAKTCDGFTLYTSEGACLATLIDMRGNVVHRWSAPFRSVWPEARLPQVRNPASAENMCFAGCHLYPDGDLLAVFEAPGQKPCGCGLARLDKDSKVRWRYSANVHSELDVAEDGRIYALKHEILAEAPGGLELFGSPCLLDSLVVLSPEGALLEQVPIHEAFTNSAYKAMLGMVDNLSSWQIGAGLAGPAEKKSQEPRTVDVFGANFVQYLTPKLVQAARLPNVEAGQVLVSLGNLDTTVVIDTARRQVVWAGTGPWRRQHGPQLLDDGSLLLLDSAGVGKRRSRVLQCDPRTNAFCWNYPDRFGATSFDLTSGGSVQRLPNGNTFIVDRAKGELLEVTEDKEPVWRCDCRGKVPSACRYLPEQVQFLSQRPRP